MEIKKITYSFLSCILLFMTIVLIGGCSDEATNVPWDSYKNQGNDANPTITSIKGYPAGWPEPSEGSWAAIDTLTIVGTNFTPDTTYMSVYFDKAKAQIVSITSTEIKVKAPAVISDSITVRVTKSTAEQVATFPYKLKEAIGNKAYAFGSDVEIRAITFDKTGQLYASMVESGKGTGIWKISKTDKGEIIKESFVLHGSETYWFNLKFAGDRLFGARGLKGVWLLTQGAVPASQPFVTLPQNINDFDFALNNNMYAAGQANIYIVNLNTKAVTAITSTIKAAAVRVFDNYVYLAGTKGTTTEGVWRFAITGATTLGPEEVVGILPNPSTEVKIQGMTIDINGGIILTTTTKTDPLVTIKNGSVSKLFPGSLPTTTNSKYITWIPGSQYILYTRDYQTLAADGTTQHNWTDLVKVMAFSNSAPYIGLQL